MIEEIKNAIARGGRERMTIGIDLDDEGTQISYSLGDGMPLTLSAGDDRLLIPTVMAKRYEENSWVCGREALRLAAAGDAQPVDHLLYRAIRGESVLVDQLEYSPTDMLALFLRKCLGQLVHVAPIERVAAIVISVADPEERLVAVLSDVIRILRLKKERVFIQSHAESAFYYIMHQAQELRACEVMICDLRSRGLTCMLYRRNTKIRPPVMLMTQKSFSNVAYTDLPEGKKKDIDRQQMDQGFYSDLYSMLEGHTVSSVYLVGEGFEEQWYPRSLKYICKGRRAFRGNNLYSQGACYSARIKAGISDALNIVFLGKDKIKANIGLFLDRKEKEVCRRLLEAGHNWYESNVECDLITDSIRELRLRVAPLDGKNIEDVSVRLDGLPVRPPRATRLHLEVGMSSEEKVRIKVTDLGFGEFFPSSGLVWEQEIRL